MDKRPIGVFDSGVGGLTVLNECLVAMPHEDFVYLGDSARCPYGPRALSDIRRFALELGRYLEHAGVKLIVVACNSASAASATLLARKLGIPVVGVLDGDVRAAARATRNRRIGVLATEATIESRRHALGLEAFAPGATVVSVACPRLVPLIEACAPAIELESAVVEYAGELADASVDTAILGCIHYPLIRPMFQRALGEGTALSSPGEETATEIGAMLAELGLENRRGRRGTCTFMTTGSADEFRAAARRFLHLPLGDVQRVTLERRSRWPLRREGEFRDGHAIPPWRGSAVSAADA